LNDDKIAWYENSEPVRDFGDAPLPYPTTRAENGARHGNAGATLGTFVNVVADGAHSANANGEANPDDGVTFGTIQVGALAASVSVEVNDAGSGAFLHAWIDFNGDGSWGGPGEQIAAGVAVGNGTSTITFDVPSWAKGGVTFARFRVSSVGNLGVTGVAPDGEVEDYAVTIVPPATAGGTFLDTTVSTTADFASSVFAADVDGDGDMDMLSSSVADDTIAWHENDGNENFTKRVISNTAESAQSVFAADVDGDGDMDVLSASINDNTIAWYENTGSQVFTEAIISTAADAPVSVFAADVDGDGDMDVLSASLDDDTIAWYENNGGQVFTKRIISTTADFASSVFAADVDGDGDMDVLSASINDSTIAWYENNGSQVFTERIISIAAEGATSVFAADVDGDGDTDVLSAAQTDNTIAWYENNGSQVFVERPISTTADGALSVFAADVDGDGDLDVLSALSNDDTIAWYENITATLTATLTSGVLNITDTAGRANSLTISVSGSDLVITDSNEAFTSAPAGATLSNRNKTLRVPIASITNSVIVNLGGGTNQITVSKFATTIGTGLTLNGGSSNDTYRFDADNVLGTIRINESGSGIDTIDFGLTTTQNVALDLSLTTAQTINANMNLQLNSAIAIDNAIGGTQNDSLTGNARANTLTGGSGDDMLNGKSGNDVLLGGRGNDTYAFNATSSAEADQVTELSNQGTDTLTFQTLSSAVTLSLATVAVQNVHANRTIKLSSTSTFENIIGGSASDRLTGNSLNNTLTGNNGSDTFNGGAGNDELFGGQGDDTYSFSNAAAAEADKVTELSNQGIDTLNFSAITIDVIVSLSSTAIQSVHTNRTLKLNSGITFENIIGGSANDTLLGNKLANQLSGGSGNNILVGLDGSDVLTGGSGRDILIGGRGLDTLTGGSNEDILIAGRTTSDTNLTNLNKFRTQWTSANTYTQRIINLRAGVGVPPSSLKAKTNVFNDSGEDDVLTGGTGQDWYFRATDDAITDLFANETVDLL
jgi:hypothetical protein